MAGQSVDRRLVLRYMGLASAAASFPGFHRWAFAFAQHPTPAESPRQGLKIYQSLFFFAGAIRDGGAPCGHDLASG